MKKDIFKLTVLLLFLMAGLSSCLKEKVCDVKNPLTDLLWLKEVVNNTPVLPTNIYQCTYNNDIDGFLIDPCVGCFIYQILLYNCEGTILFDSQKTQNGEIDFNKWNIKNEKLIWTNIK